jgi:DNA polymerase
MAKIVDEATVPMLAEFTAITGLPKLGSPKLLPWCAARGVSLPNLQKETIATILKEEDHVTEDYESLADEETVSEGTEELPENVRRALHIKQLVGSASVKKLPRAKACVSSDNRVRGSLQYHGAGPGLWAGRLLQPHNFPRGTITAAEAEGKDDFVARKVEALQTGDWKHVEETIGPAVETVVSSLRHIIVPSLGRELVVGDFAGIQARIALAASGQHDKTALMAAGADVYLDMASAIFKRPVVKAETEARQYGKNSVLGLGFQMGWKTFKRRYARNQTDEFCEGVVHTYRYEWAPKVPKLWYGLDAAARDTVWERTPHEAYGVLYQLEDNWLTAHLPSGRKLHYFNPQQIRKVMPWSNSDAPDVRRAWKYQAMKQGVFKSIDAFGGLLTENLASALARDLLVAAMFKCEKHGLPIVLTVHDEIICDAEKRVDNATVLRQIMEDSPPWAKAMQIPLAAETWAGQRYRK